MIECCKTCGSILNKGDCSNQNCPDKQEETNKILDKILDEMDIKSGIIFACPRNGTGCMVKKISK